VAAQILGLGAFDSTNSAQIIKPSPGICAVMGGAGFTKVTARANVPDALRQPTEIYTNVIGKSLVCRAPIGMALLARQKGM